MKKLLFAAIALFVFQFSHSQTSNPVTENNASEYYYCFAMFADSVFYTGIFGVPMDTVSKMPYVEEKWTTHVKQIMKREQYFPVVIGPYMEAQTIQADQDNWITIFPDSVSVIKILYTLE